MKKPTAKKKTLGLIALLLSSIAFASALAGYMIYYHSPSTRYLAANAIISPEAMEKINEKDKHPVTGQPIRFVFHGIEFSYFDTIANRQRRSLVDPSKYGAFYELVKSDKSLESIDDRIKAEFNQRPVLTIEMIASQDNRTSQPLTKTLQLIQVVDSDYFRVQLLYDTNRQAGEWAYFYQPNSYSEIIHLFTQT